MCNCSNWEEEVKPKPVWIQLLPLLYSQNSRYFIPSDFVQYMMFKIVNEYYENVYLNNY